MKNYKFEILVVDDDDAHRTMLRTLVGGWGYAIHEANDGSVAIEMVKERPFDLIIMDIKMIKVSGLEALNKIKEINVAIPVVIMTAYSSIETAVDALKKGAYDYMTKPLDFDKLKHLIKNVMEHVQLKEENRRLRINLGNKFDDRSIIGRSPAMIKILETVKMVASSDATVLITGESGSGKELIAGAIHYNSPRKEGPYIKINCAAITETLLESELFGHEKGSFTGADRKKDGKFIQASGGSLFLDEVSEMSLAMQVKLLRVLQEQEVTRVGGDDVIKFDVRVIAATNKDVSELIKSGEFRKDLYYRLNVIDLKLPELKERIEDIPLLAQSFLEKFSKKNRKDFKGFTPAAMNYLMKHDWPGNVRELMNTIERGVVFASGDYIDIDNISSIPVNESKDDNGIYSDILNSGKIVPLAELEKQAVLTALDIAKGNKSKAARELGITRKTLHKKLKQFEANP